MNWNRAGVLEAAILAGLLGACADREGVLVSPSNESATVASVEGLAHALAMGMANDRVRGYVRDAMRASPLTDHKVSFKEFVASSRGRELLQAAAVASGGDLTEMETRITGMPDLDFYLPVRQHRLAWRGGADYLVAVDLSGNAPTSGYRLDGSVVPLDVTRSAPPREALFLLETAERKSRRINAQPDIPGSVVQDANDGEISGTLLTVGANGEAKEFALADLVERENAAMMQCYEDCGGGGWWRSTARDFPHAHPNRRDSRQQFPLGNE